MSANSFHHIPVLFNETIDSLNIKPDGIYVDCTSGGGGHSTAIAKRLTTGRLISIDRDPQAIETLKERLGGFECVTVVHDNFFNIKSVLANLGISGVDGVLADLGVSSHQLDEPSRGFSFHHDAPLDMRMSIEGMSAADAVNNLSQQELQKIIFDYGEEKFAPRIVSEIVREREVAPIETTDKLVEIIRRAIPMAAQREGGHPAKRTFQALRIAVNNELDIIAPTLKALCAISREGGRVAVLTFHSLEDRLVKLGYKELSSGCTCPRDFPVCVCGNKASVKVLSKKPILPSKEELAINPRSRSAKLRICEKL